MSRISAATPTRALAPSLTDVAWAAGVAVAYFLAAKLGLALATVGVTVTLVWPPSGVAVAALLLRGPRVWPGVMIGAFAANATTGAPISVAFFTALGNPLKRWSRRCCFAASARSMSHSSAHAMSSR